MEGIETFCTGVVNPILDRKGSLSSGSADSGYMSDEMIKETYKLNTFVQLGKVGCYKRGSAQDKDVDITETDFVIVVSTTDRSVWLLYNFYFDNDDGVAIRATSDNRDLFQRIPSYERRFTCARIADDVRDMYLCNPDKEVTIRPVFFEEYKLTHVKADKEGNLVKVLDEPDRKAQLRLSLIKDHLAQGHEQSVGIMDSL